MHSAAAAEEEEEEEEKGGGSASAARVPMRLRASCVQEARGTSMASTRKAAVRVMV